MTTPNYNDPSQNSLVALIPIKAVAVDGLREKLEQNPVDPAGLNDVGVVHFARIFVFEQNNPSGVPSNLLAVITAYDSPFDTYIQSFVNQPSVGAFFNEVMTLVDDPQAQAVIPVQKNSAAFAELIKKYDATNPANAPWGQWYSAYPDLTVQNILAQNPHEAPTS